MRKPVGQPSESQELLLTAALGDATTAPQAWKRWCQNHDLKTVDDGSRRLLPLVGHNLGELGCDVEESASIIQITRLGWARNQLLFKSIGDVARLFNDGGIDFLLTKGLPLALVHYPSSALRPMNDGDILVRLKHFDRAIALLKEAGWTHALEEIPSAAHHALPFRNAARQEIDVHRFALGECPFSPDDENFWQGAVSISVGGISALATNPTDSLFMACANSVHSPLRWVADSVLLSRHNEIDWKRIENHARKRKLSFVTYAALTYLKDRHDAPIPAPVLAALHSIPVSWLEKREYYWWDKADSSAVRLLLRYASFRRIHGAQNLLGFLNYVRQLGDLKSTRQIPFWLLSRAFTTLRPSVSPTVKSETHGRH